MGRLLILRFLLPALFMFPSCAASTVHGHFINAGERNYDLMDGKMTLCSNIAPKDSCDFTMSLGNHSLVAAPRVPNLPDWLDTTEIASLSLNVQHHDYVFLVSKDPNPFLGSRLEIVR